MKRVYLDHAATTPLHPEVLEAMTPYFTEHFGNSSSTHWAGRAAREAVDRARENLADALGCRPTELVFSSGATESNNLAILGAARAAAQNGDSGRGRHVVMSAIEHKAALEPAERLEAEGFQVTRVAPGADGTVEAEAVLEAVRPDTLLVSVMYANNETGVIQPVEAIGLALREREVLFHTDAAQALGKLPVDLNLLPVDMLSGSAHKFYGPKGTGFLYLSRRVKLQPLLYGGGHERGRRAGTLDVPGIVGMARALELAEQGRAEETQRLRGLRDDLETRLSGRLEGLRMNGRQAPRRLPHLSNFCIEGVDGEGVLADLSQAGIAVSSGSACTAEDAEPSHVLLAMGLPPEVAQGSVRVSMGLLTDQAAVDWAVEMIVQVTERQRAISPMS